MSSWPLTFIQGHSFGPPHTYLNIFFFEITGLFNGLFIIWPKWLQPLYMVKQNLFHYKRMLTLTYFNIIKEIRWAPHDFQIL